MDNNTANIVDGLQTLAGNTSIKFDFSGWPGAATAMTAIIATAATICFCKYLAHQ